jgi:hypothetical protein
LTLRCRGRGFACRRVRLAPSQFQEEIALPTDVDWNATSRTSR